MTTATPIGTSYIPHDARTWERFTAKAKQVVHLGSPNDETSKGLLECIALWLTWHGYKPQTRGNFVRVTIDERGYHIVTGNQSPLPGDWSEFRNFRTLRAFFEWLDETIR